MADEPTLKEAPQVNEVQVAGKADLKQQKVQLDLDDAPFLREEQASPPAEREMDSTKPALPEQADNAASESKTGRKKLIIFAGIAGILLIAALAAGGWFFLRKPPSPPPEAVKPEVIVVPSKPTAQAIPDYTKDFAPFLIYHSDGQVTGRFLICKFATLTKTPNLNREMDQKMLPLRDAVYYYLRSKPPEYLTNPGNMAEIKKDLIASINNYLTQGQIEDVLLESYLSE